MIEPTEKVSGEQPQDRVVNLLDREAPPGYSTEWTAHVAAEKKGVEPGIKSVVIFRIDKEWLALSTDMFQEVIDQYTIRTLPDHRGGIVKGLINVRGELLLCIALEVVLGMENTEVRTPKDRLLIFGRGRFAVQVSEVFGVHRYHPNELRLTPATLRNASSGSYTLGILRWQGNAVACLDEALLLYALNKGLA
jgi:chemotaxis-related protein WspD